MKIAICSFVFLIGSCVWAAFPKNVTCSSSEDPNLYEFHIFDVDTKNPSVDLDASLLDYDVSNSTYSIWVSNECDNNIGVQFRSAELEAMAAGKVQFVTGMVDYSSANIDESEWPGQRVRATILCREYTP